MGTPVGGNEGRFENRRGRVILLVCLVEVSKFMLEKRFDKNISNLALHKTLHQLFSMFCFKCFPCFDTSIFSSVPYKVKRVTVTTFVIFSYLQQTALLAKMSNLINLVMRRTMSSAAGIKHVTVVGAGLMGSGEKFCFGAIGTSTGSKSNNRKFPNPFYRNRSGCSSNWPQRDAC